MDAIHRHHRGLAVALLAATLLAGVGCATTPPAPRASTAPLPAPTLRTLVRSPSTPDESPGDVLAVEVLEPLALPGLEPGRIVAPYPLVNVISTFGDCRPGGRQHRGIDLAGVGERLGLGDPIVAMVDAEVTFIGRPEDDPEQFGTPDRRPGTVERGDHTLPRAIEVEGYGTVYPFTRNAGSWRSGAVVVTKVLGGPLDGYTVRYMHLGAVHPQLTVGAVVAAGEPIGVMGGTGVQSSPPHLHLDIEDLEGKRVDAAPLLGLEPDTSTCRAKRRAAKKKKKKKKRR